MTLGKEGEIFPRITVTPYTDYYRQKGRLSKSGSGWRGVDMDKQAVGVIIFPG
jgi:hypothetical protein